MEVNNALLEATAQQLRLHQHLALLENTEQLLEELLLETAPLVLPVNIVVTSELQLMVLIVRLGSIVLLDQQ